MPRVHRSGLRTLPLAIALTGCAGPVVAPEAGSRDTGPVDARASDDRALDAITPPDRSLDAPDTDVASDVTTTPRDGGLDALTPDAHSADAATDVHAPDARSPDAASGAFVPGVTMPYYEVTADFTGAKNVGNLPGVPLVRYPGGCDGGTLILPAGTYTNVDFGNCTIEIRGNATLNNCRSVLTHNYDTTLGEHIRIFNGATTTSVTINDSEFHNRSQRIVDGLKGRNFVVNRSVFTGYVDGVDNGSPGSAPQLTGGEIHDSWIGDHAWWRAATGGVVHPTDTQTHNDGSQVTTALGIRIVNTFFGAWASEYVGTGTPGSGSGTNPFVAPYIVDQATMESWRTTYLNRFTRPDQSWNGRSHRLSTGGSWAAVMANASGGTVDHCWFSGGTATINLLDPASATNTWSIHRSVFWNDMSGGRPLDSTIKGVAIYVRPDRTYDIPVTGANANHWFDGTVVTPNVM